MRSSALELTLPAPPKTPSVPTRKKKPPSPARTFSNVEDGEVDLGDDGINPNPQVGNDRVERLEGSRSAAAQTRRTLVAESSSDGGRVPRSIGDDDAKVDVEVALATRRSGEGAPVGVEPAEGDVDGADDFEIERGGGG